jgi:hypothetical protein
VTEGVDVRLEWCYKLSMNNALTTAELHSIATAVRASIGGAIEITAGNGDRNWYTVVRCGAEIRFYERAKFANHVGRDVQIAIHSMTAITVVAGGRERALAERCLAIVTARVAAVTANRAAA